MLLEVHSLESVFLGDNGFKLVYAITIEVLVPTFNKGNIRNATFFLGILILTLYGAFPENIEHAQTQKL